MSGGLEEGVDTRDLGWFLVLARVEHVTDAAARLGVSQPTLSRSLARLERHLGKQLFDREGNRLKLNRYGKIYADHAHRALEELASAESRIAELADPAEGEIILGYQSWLGPWLIPDLIGRFRCEAPGVRFSLRAGRSQMLGEELERGVFDLILTTRPTEWPAKWQCVLTEDLFLAVPRDHRFAGRSSISLREAQHEKFVMPLAGLRHVIGELFQNAGFTPEVTTESHELTTIRGLVAAGLGVAVLHSDHGGSTPDVCYIPLSDPGSRRNVGMAWIDDRPESPMVAKFRHFVIELAAQYERASSDRAARPYAEDGHRNGRLDLGDA